MVERIRPRWILAAALAAALGLVALPGLGEGTGDRGVAEQTLAQISPEAAAGPAQDYVRRAKAALERGTRLRAARDDARALLADKVAREWAEAARDLATAADAEKAAARARSDAADAGAQLDRERALLEEGIAQAGRLRAQIEALERAKKDGGAK
jgi:hypothetical protein